MSSPASSPLPVRLSPERAILKKDGAELKACLDKGWNPEGPYGLDGRPTYPEVERIVFRGWDEGWRLARARWPNLALEIRLIKLAFRRLHAPILEDMFKEGEIGISQPIVEEKTAIMLAIEALGMPEGIPPGDENTSTPFDRRAVEVFDWLIKSGADPYAPYPGEYHPRDTTCAGHSAWTRALFNMRWPLAMHLMPPEGADITQQPRWRQAIEQLVEEASNPLQTTRQMARSIYALWIERFGPWWFTQPDVVPPHQPDEWGYIIGLPKAVRQKIWAAWDLPQDHAVNVFHTLAQEAKHKDIIPVLTKLLDDVGEPAGWMQPSVEGVRPCDLWALVLDGTCPEQPWTLSEALKQTRQRGSGLLTRAT